MYFTLKQKILQVLFYQLASDVDLALKFLEIGDYNINLMTKHEKQTFNSI